MGQFVTMSSKEFREYLNGLKTKNPTSMVKNNVSEQKTSKYKAKRTESDGISFDSKKEAQRWQELNTMASAGVISDLERQKPFILQEAFTDKQGRKHKPITYVSDFSYKDMEGNIIVEDVKSKMTRQLPVYRIKKKLFIYKYPDITFNEFL